MHTAQLLTSLPSRISAIPRHWAERAPLAPALHHGQRHWTYAELTAAVNDAAALLRA
jgi:long-chain acyl-CoA synthetase